MRDRSAANHRYNTSEKGRARQARYREAHRQERQASQREYWLRVGHFRRRRSKLATQRVKVVEELLFVHEGLKRLALELGLPEDRLVGSSADGEDDDAPQARVRWDGATARFEVSR